MRGCARGPGRGCPLLVGLHGHVYMWLWQYGRFGMRNFFCEREGGEKNSKQCRQIRELRREYRNGGKWRAWMDSSRFKNMWNVCGKYAAASPPSPQPITPPHTPTPNPPGGALGTSPADHPCERVRAEKREFAKERDAASPRENLIMQPTSPCQYHP